MRVQLHKAINSGHIGGYASDVFEFEDLSIKDRPKKINQELLNLKDKTFLLLILAQQLMKLDFLLN